MCGEVLKRIRSCLETDLKTKMVLRKLRRLTTNHPKLLKTVALTLLGLACLLYFSRLQRQGGVNGVSKRELKHFSGGKIVNPHDYAYLNQARSCKRSGVGVDLVVMVSSAVGHADRRNSIRESWGSTDRLSQVAAKVIFLLGRPDLTQTRDAIDEESTLHGDILQEDFVVRL